MKRHHILLKAVMFASLLGAYAQRAAAQESQPVVHAVLFYSPTCGHCEYVITETLPPLYEKYGAQLQIIGFDVSQPQGQAMFTSALEHFGLQQPSVPLLVIDDITLVGSVEIPEQFPALVEGYLALGGAPWPGIPGLRDMLVSAAQAATAQGPQLAATPAPGALSAEPPGTGWRERFAADPAANTIAVMVLLGMLAALVWGVILFRRSQVLPIFQGNLVWLIPVLCALGLAVAGYLAYVETADVSAVCGPIGDCNSVQQSTYARLFGILSIGALGLIGYMAMGAAWALARFGRGRTAHLAAISIFLIALVGTLFSVYLTFLEPFVIGATCAWCLTSAVLITALMLLSAGAAGRAFTLTAAPTAAPVKPRSSARRVRPR